VTIYGSIRYGHRGGFGDLYTGDCRTVEQLNTVLHLGINLLSTLVLNASNYCAQILASPTRREIDTAHSKEDWLDIGVPSVRNLLKGRISGRRRVVWFILLSSSALLHLTWNSAVLATLPRNNYQLAVVTSDYAMDLTAWPVNTPQAQDLQWALQNNRLTALDFSDCWARYTNTTIALGDVVIVADNITMDMNLPKSNGSGPSTIIFDTHSSLLWEDWNAQGDEGWIYGGIWMCSAFYRIGDFTGRWCTADLLASQRSDWIISYYPGIGFGSANTQLTNVTTFKVRSCLSAGSQTWETGCSVRYSLGILIIVCILNGLKAAAIIYTYSYWDHGTRSRSADKQEIRELDYSLVTVGDAVASFLQFRDPTTNNLPLVMRADFKRGWPSEDDVRRPGNGYDRLLSGQRWAYAASWRRWAVTIVA